MKAKFFEINLPAIWASYLINGDASGIEESDKKQCDKDTKNWGRCVSVGDDTFFGTYRGIGYDLASYMFASPIAPKDALKQILFDVNTKYGAPMGRYNTGMFDWPGHIYDRKVRLNSGGYDRGGAYWGIGGGELRVTFNGALTWIRFYRKETK